MSEELLALAKGVLDKAKAKMADEIKAWNKSFQIETEEGDKFFIKIADGEITLDKGEIERPTATLKMSREVLEKILKGEMDAMAAFIRGKMKITGNVIETANLRKLIEAGIKG